jgi:hypothetical protein
MGVIRAPTLRKSCAPTEGRGRAMSVVDLVDGDCLWARHYNQQSNGIILDCDSFLGDYQRLHTCSSAKRQRMLV